MRARATVVLEMEADEAVRIKEALNFLVEKCECTVDNTCPNCGIAMRIASNLEMVTP